MVLHLLRSIYQSDIQLPTNPEFYEHSLKDIEYFSISPQVFHLLKQTQQLQNTPEFFQERLAYHSDQALYQNVFIKMQMRLILEAFEKNNIQVIPLKGIPFTEKYFGHLSARWTTDIDLLIRKSDLDKAVKCVISLGFAQEEEPPHFHISLNKHFPNLSVPIAVELHWNLVREETSAIRIEEFWKQSKPYQTYQNVMELSAYHTFYMICLHSWRHNLNSLKYVIDIVQLIHRLKNDLDYANLWKDASTDQTLKRIRKTLTIVYQLFPHLQDMLVLTDKADYTIWWNYEGIRDLTQKTHRQYLNLIQFKYLDYDLHTHMFYEIGNWIFPSSTDLIYELGNTAGQNRYIQLYKKRIKSCVRFLLRQFLWKQRLNT